MNPPEDRRPTKDCCSQIHEPTQTTSPFSHHTSPTVTKFFSFSDQRRALIIKPKRTPVLMNEGNLSVLLESCRVFFFVRAFPCNGRNHPVSKIISSDRIASPPTGNAMQDPSLATPLGHTQLVVDLTTEPFFGQRTPVQSAWLVFFTKTQDAPTTVQQQNRSTSTEVMRFC